MRDICVCARQPIVGKCLWVQTKTDISRFLCKEKKRTSEDYQGLSKPKYLTEFLWPIYRYFSSVFTAPFQSVAIVFISRIILTVFGPTPFFSHCVLWVYVLASGSKNIPRGGPAASFSCIYCTYNIVLHTRHTTCSVLHTCADVQDATDGPVLFSCWDFSDCKNNVLHSQIWQTRKWRTHNENGCKATTTKIMQTTIRDTTKEWTVYPTSQPKPNPHPKFYP